MKRYEIEILMIDLDICDFIQSKLRVITRNYALLNFAKPRMF